MIIQELEQVEIDHCLSCGGIWLDAGELEMLLGDQQMPIPLMETATKEHKRRCPVCRKKMEKVLSPDAGHDTLLDRCTRGHGIWFDAGELQKVIENKSIEHPVARLLREMFRDSGIQST
jgi:Zn-finger nucleic acid-binding protein